MSRPLDLTSEQLSSIEYWKQFASPRALRLLTEVVTGQPLAPTPLEIFCPHQPWPKQWKFLQIDAIEAFYGGAAAGGKSEALLMAALMYVDIPGYSALILRRDTQRLKLSGGLIPRSHEWLKQVPAALQPKWNGTDRKWTFVTPGAPATLSFGYLMHPGDKYRYGSSEYQFIAFDELTEFPEEDYLFLFSRLRRAKAVNAPLRIRAASNPGSLGHAWVKRRFIPDHAARNDHSLPEIVWHQGRAYIPAKIADNPAIDETEYRANLINLPAVTRERLMQGDWSVREEGLIRAEWLRSYIERQGTLDLLDRHGQSIASVAETDCRRFATIDPAGSSADRAREDAGRPASWTVVQVWDQPTSPPLRKFVLLRECRRERVGFDGLLRLIRDTHRQWQPRQMWIENEKLGQAAVDLLGGSYPLRTIATRGKDKVARAAPLLAKLERGEILLPRYDNGWRIALEGEWLGWTGHPEETSDQVDAAAYAAQIAEEILGEPIVIQTIGIW